MIITYESEMLKAVCEKLDVCIRYKAAQKAMIRDGVITSEIVRKVSFSYGISADDFNEMMSNASN